MYLECIAGTRGPTGAYNLAANSTAAELGGQSLPFYCEKSSTVIWSVCVRSLRLARPDSIRVGAGITPPPPRWENPRLPGRLSVPLTTQVPKLQINQPETHTTETVRARHWALLAQQDPRLVHLINAWSSLSAAMRDAITALVNAAILFAHGGKSDDPA